MEQEKGPVKRDRCGRGPSFDRMRALNIFLWALLIVPSSCITLFPSDEVLQSVSAQRAPGDPLDDPNVTIEMEQEALHAHVAPGDDGIVTARGTVYCQMPEYAPDAVYCIVKLIASAGNWPVSYPPELAFNRATVRQDFTVTIQVPEHTSPSDSNELQISGTWYYSPGVTYGTVGSKSVHIEVLPFTYLIISCNRDNVTVDKGNHCYLEVDVQNIGTKSTTARIEAYPSDEGINVTYDKSSFTLGPGIRKKVFMTFEQTDGPAGYYQVEMIAVDEDPEGLNSPHITVNLLTKERPFSLKNIPFYLKSFAVLSVISIIVALLVIIILRRRKRDRELLSRSDR